MPIKSLQHHTTRPALRNLGKLRKGGEKPQGGFGVDLTYFRFTSPDPAVAQAFGAAYGERPAMLRVYLPYDTPEQNFESWKEEWGGQRLKHRCDGEYCVKWRNANGSYTVDAGMKERHPCPGGCREVGRLTVILPELWHAGFVGLVTLETHSVNDIVHIGRVLEDTMQRSAGVGRGLQGIEFALSRVPEMISTPDGRGGRRQVERWLVHIEPAGEWLLAQLASARQGALGGAAGPSTPYDRPEDEGDPLHEEEPADEPEAGAGAGVSLPAAASPVLAPEAAPSLPAEEEVLLVAAPQRARSGGAGGRRPTAQPADPVRAPAPRPASTAPDSGPARRWQDDPARVAEFKARCEALELKGAAVLQLLGGVRRVSQVPFSFEDTLAVLEGRMTLQAATEKARSARE